MNGAGLGGTVWYWNGAPAPKEAGGTVGPGADPEQGHQHVAAMLGDALEGKGPQRRSQRQLDRRLEEVEAVGSGYCRLQMPLKPALGVRGTVAGHRLGALGRGVVPSPPFQCIPGNACAEFKDGPGLKGPRHEGQASRHSYDKTLVTSQGQRHGHRAEVRVVPEAQYALGAVTGEGPRCTVLRAGTSITVP